ncbi:MAG: tetratricopeptide repeat protein, partial [Thermodesulfobacteriota bacterium]
IGHARAGRWAEAAGCFEGAVRAAEADPEVKPASLARARWDLGLAYGYAGRWDEAEALVRQACAVLEAPECAKEIENLARLRRDKERLDRQLDRRTGP